MSVDYLREYSTYKDIQAELDQPIEAKDLDLMTLKKLYESKLVYLEHLRVSCFKGLNHRGAEVAGFEEEDYVYILSSLAKTRMHMKDLVLESLRKSFGSW